MAAAWPINPWAAAAGHRRAGYVPPGAEDFCTTARVPPTNLAGARRPAGHGRPKATLGRCGRPGTGYGGARLPGRRTWCGGLSSPMLAPRAEGRAGSSTSPW